MRRIALLLGAIIFVMGACSDDDDPPPKQDVGTQLEAGTDGPAAEAGTDAKVPDPDKGPATEAGTDAKVPDPDKGPAKEAGTDAKVAKPDGLKADSTPPSTYKIVITEFIPGFAGKIEKMFWVQQLAVTTGGKDATLNLEIETTNVTNGVLSLTSAACTPLGKVVEATAITGANVFTAAEKISVEAAVSSAFSEGAGTLHIVCSCSGVNDNFKEVADQIITQEAANTAILAATKQHTAKINVNSLAVDSAADAVAQLAAKQNVTSTALGVLADHTANTAAELVLIAADVAAGKTTVDLVLADLAEIGLHAAS